ncbi:phosphocholine-specific phospholipase C [Psychromicrobium lacuslunae]|uniref:phospholipase C n=1 Tax=Psychromicrobium lacuslunae TaxID=1618207 RepID=A0A0D4C1G0_9MICC|nr:phospholipase C, phosphocholine-specific [Psychromicrobium lacuslunae]AJT42186.1 phospholipase C [Psychromicrobium lacuslunae]
MSKKKPETSNPAISWPAAPPLQPEQMSASQLPPGLSRRAALALGVASIAAGVASINAAAPAAAQQARTAAALTGTIADVKHVVILMQENRSFDHYYGNLSGVRGLSDKQALELPNNGSVLAQPAPSRKDGGVLLPFHLDSAKYNSQNAGGLDHSWSGGHKAWNNGAWNAWVNAKTPQTMGYFTRDDLPYHYALADAFTICDHYFCSVTGPTTPNRLYQWTGSINAAGGKGGPATSNPADYKPVYSWGTYGEELEKAGKSWKTYANDEVGDSGSHPYVGDYGDNPLWLFQAYHDSLQSKDPKLRALASHGGLHDGWKPDSGKGLDVNHLLADFGADCAAGTLPEVSYVVAPYGWSEHPAASPDYGAHFTNAVVQAIFSNPETWQNTVLLINYDENDGYFDHVVPPTPEPGTADEFVEGLPIGLGVRVPLTVVSPWSRGGWVNSQVFDHTSVIRFLEAWSGVKDHNISAWRREICGDLTSCFDFAHPDYSIPKLPDTAPLVAAANADMLKPAIKIPATGQQKAPQQESGSRQRRAIPYLQNANLTVDQQQDTLNLALRNAGQQAVSMALYLNDQQPFAARPFDVSASSPRDYHWKVSTVAGSYDVSVYGPDRFLRRFAGNVNATGQAAIPAVTANVSNGALELVLTNQGASKLTFTLQSNDFAMQHKSVELAAQDSESLSWPLLGGYYDVVVSADDGSGFRYRFAGHAGHAGHAG